MEPRVRRLRNLDMPVAELKAVLAPSDPDTRQQLISEHLDRLETQLAETQAAVRELQDLLGRTQVEQPVEHRTVATTPALAIHEVVDREDAVAWWQGALGELRASVSASDRLSSQPPKSRSCTTTAPSRRSTSPTATSAATS